jgi:hypothetical protein
MKPSALENCRKALLALPLMLWAASPAFAGHSMDGNILIIFENGGPNYKLGNGEFGDPPTAACMSMINTLQNSSYNDNFGSIPPGFWGGAAPKWPNQTWQPSAGSIANGTVDAVAAITYADTDTCDQCGYQRDIEQVCYRGAIDPAGADWTSGWLCAGDSAQCLPALNPPVVHTGVLGTQTWTTANTHVLRGKVTVPAGVTLTIDPGVVVLGEKATGPSFLNVAPGGVLLANGTAAQPIIMTSDQTVGVPGDWAGLLMSGDATANCADCRGDNGPPEFCNSEGDTTVTFCGTDDCDSSGVITYVRVQYSGFILGANNELNSFTFNAQGSRTVAHHLQAHRGSDDSFEWFGGTMNASYLVATGQGDDGLDWQAGFRGTVHHAVVQMAPDQGDRGIEADNWEFDFDAPCRSNPIIHNCTFIAPGPGSTSDSGIVLRRGTDAHIFNCIIYDFPDANYEIRDGESCNRGANPQVSSFCGPTGAPLIANGGNADAVSVRTFPNPVVTEAQFSLSLAHEGAARLDVYDVTGRHVANVFDGSVTPGEYSVSWTPGADVAPGAYFYRLQNGSEPVTGKFVVVR